MQRIDFIAMGCDMSIFLDATTPEATDALHNAPAWFAEWEDVFSRFRPSSELCTLNRFAGYWFHPSDAMWDVLTIALNGAALTDGRVTPTVAPQLIAAGYDRSFELLTDEAPEPSNETPVAHPVDDWRAIELDAHARRVRLPRGTALDFGGVVKGWAAEQTAQRFAHLGGVLVDAGGDLAVRGRRPDGSPWPIGVTDPRGDAEADIDLPTVLLVDAGGVATSGRDYRRWHSHGHARHHIIDSRTGLPAVTDVLSATVIAADAASAEIMAKHLLLLGCEAGMLWMQSRIDASALIVCDDGSVHTRWATSLRQESPASPSHHSV